MCGIFGLIGYDGYPNNYFETGSKRGPENSKIVRIKNNYLGFHRLAINGLNSESDQPLYYNQYILVCNGEIYNYKELIQKYNLKMNTQSDCEVIPALYEKFGDECVKMLDGEFAFILYDTFTHEVFIARDPYGVRPLYMNHLYNRYCFASDLEPLKIMDVSNITQFTPGTYMKINESNINITTYANYNKTSHTSPENTFEFYDLFIRAVSKRVNNSDRPIACLLSGGLDSSLVAAVASRICAKKGTILETYSIGLQDSEDLKFAQKVANHINSIHTTIVCSEDEFYNAIPHVIRDIESYDTTSVRASVGNWLVGKYIKEHSNAKVVLNGDGADELMGGYMYFHACPSSLEFDKECKRLLKNIHYFDVLRSDKSISSHGLEPRTPYLDIELVNYYLNIPAEIRNHTLNKNIEKHFMRTTIQDIDPTLLPYEILFRKKEAFSDGVSGLNRSWYEIIQDRVRAENIPDEIYLLNPPATDEQRYYRHLFEKYYPNSGYIITYFWMPRYVNATDASARTLNLYSLNMIQNINK